MKRFALIIGLLPSIAAAQNACPAETPPPDPCMVGTWMGENTAGQRIYDMIQRNPPPGVDRTTFPVPPAILGITIFEDGYYATLPLNTETGWDDVYKDDRVEVTMEFAVGSEFGRIWSTGNNVNFCTIGGNFVSLLMEVRNSQGQSGTVPILPTNEGSFVPVMPYNCSGDFMQFTVQLPAPIGNVNYSLQKFSEDRFSEEWRDLLELRGEIVIDPIVFD